jgi:DNA repair protein RadC
MDCVAGETAGVCCLNKAYSGDPTPSRADVEMTQAIVAVARPLGIALHDHIIVGKDGHSRIKALKLIYTG